MDPASRDTHPILLHHHLLHAKNVQKVSGHNKFPPRSSIAAVSSVVVNTIHTVFVDRNIRLYKQACPHAIIIGVDPQQTLTQHQFSGRWLLFRIVSLTG
jgi:hypothetical protein